MADAVFTLPDDQIATFSCELEDAYGNVVPTPADASPPTASSSDPTVVDATIDGAGHLAVQSPGGKLGTAQVTVTITHANGTPWTAIQSVNVVAGAVTQIGLKPLEMTAKATTPTTPEPPPATPPTPPTP